MRHSSLVKVISSLAVVSLTLAACSGGDTAQVTESVERQADSTGEPAATIVGGAKKLPTKIPTQPFEAFNSFFEGLEFIDGIVSCFEPQGCFGDKGKYELNGKLDKISEQLTEIRAEIAEGFAVTNLNIAESNYASAERDYNTRYGTHIPDAIKQLQRMGDANLSVAARKAAQRDFKREAQVLMPGSAESAMRDYLTTLAGSGRSLNQGGLLGAAWKLITAGERQGQGDSSAEAPLYLSASSVNLMVAIGTEHLTEGAQLAGILAAYTVLLDPEGFSDDTEYQELLRAELTSIWNNGVSGIPGAAAITAALPRTLSDQSGVFTTGFGLSKSQGMVVRNFGRVVDSENRTGPLINGDSGYALTPAFDQWLRDTKKFADGGARRELAISRTAVDWAFDRGSKTLSTNVTKDTKMPYVTDLADFTSEYGALQATHPKTSSGQVAGFAKAGTAPEDQIQWEFDLKRQVINPAGRGDLCLGYSTRFESSSFPGNGAGGKWSNSYNLIGPRFTNGEYSFMLEYEQNLRLPRVSLKTCEKSAMMEWFLQGPIPQDGLPFWDTNALVGLSASNIAATEEDGYPLNLWKNLSLEDAKNMRTTILGRGMRLDRLFQLYGSTQTNGADRSLPPVLHPALWVGKYPSKDNVNVPSGPYTQFEDYQYSWTGVPIPVLDNGNKTFYFIGSNGKINGTANPPWISTAAILGIDVDACTFLFELPQNDAFSCGYKSDVMDQLRVPLVQISADSPVMLTADSPTATRSPSPSESVSPSPSESVSPSPSESVSPSPSESVSPSPSESVSPSPSESVSPSPSEDSAGGD